MILDTGSPVAWAGITLMGVVWDDHIYPYANDAEPVAKEKREKMIKSIMMSHFEAGLIESVEMVEDKKTKCLNFLITLCPDPCQGEGESSYALFETDTGPKVEEIARLYLTYKKMEYEKSVELGTPFKLGLPTSNPDS